MVFTPESSECGGNPLKPFRCYHLIADNIFKLLNSNQACNNSNKNNNSIQINGLEKNAGGHSKYNNSLEQTDVGVLINPTNEILSNTNNPTPHQQTNHTAVPSLSNINTNPNQSVKLQPGDISQTQPQNIARRQITSIKKNSKNTNPKLTYKRKIKKSPIKIKQKEFEDIPNNKNFTHYSTNDISVDTPDLKQSNFKDEIKKKSHTEKQIFKC